MLPKNNLNQFSKKSIWVKWVQKSIKEYQSISKYIKEYQCVSKSIKVYKRVSKSIKEYQRVSNINQFNRVKRVSKWLIFAPIPQDSGLDCFGYDYA